MATIRETTAAGELDFCGRLMASSPPWSVLNFTPEQCIQDLNHPGIQVHVLDHPQDGIVGFVATMAHGIGFEPIVEYICTVPGSRGKGVGTTLLRFVDQELFREADNLYLFVSDINPDAARLYIRFGFQPIGILPDYNLPGQTEFLYRKTRGPKQVTR